MLGASYFSPSYFGASYFGTADVAVVAPDVLLAGPAKASLMFTSSPAGFLLDGAVMATNKQFSQDDYEDIVVQLGTVAAPQGTAGATIAIISRNHLTGTVVSGVGQALGAAELGVVTRPWEVGEKPISKTHLTIEVVLTMADGSTRTFPSPDESEMVAVITPRRTTA